MSKNAISAAANARRYGELTENQQGTLRQAQGLGLERAIRDTSETTRQTPVTKSEAIAYLNGAIHDATLNKGRRIRFGQKDKRWLEYLKQLLRIIGCNSWIYKEGKTRNLYILETLSRNLDFKLDPRFLRTQREKIFYVRGFFDAEGGIPVKPGRFYIQLVQKNFSKIKNLKTLIEDLGINVGKVHNPSKRVNPDYWRIFIRTDSHKKFAEIVNSNHPVKVMAFRERMKI